MPRTAAQFEAIRDESRERLLESALLLFAERGYANTSIRMIAQKAGVSQGLLYNYFASKEQLLHAICERSMRDVRESFEMARSGETPYGQLEGLVRASLAVVGRNREFWKLSYGLRFQPEVLGGLGPAVAEWSNAILQELEEVVRTLGVPEPEIESRVLFALIDGLAQHSVLDPQHYPLEKVVSVVLARYRDAPARPD